MEVLKKDLPGCLFFGRVGLAIGFILLQTKQTNSELGIRGPDAQRSYFYHLVYANIPKYDACQIHI